MRRKHTLPEFIAVLRKYPWSPVKVLARKAGVRQRQVQKWIREIEVEVRKGRDPDNGRANVMLYAICLPPEKMAAVGHAPAT